MGCGPKLVRLALSEHQLCRDVTVQQSPVCVLGRGGYEPGYSNGRERNKLFTINWNDMKMRTIYLTANNNDCSACFWFLFDSLIAPIDYHYEQFLSKLTNAVSLKLIASPGLRHKRRPFRRSRYLEYSTCSATIDIYSRLVLAKFLSKIM